MRVLISKMGAFLAASVISLSTLSFHASALSGEETSTLIANLYNSSIKTHAALNAFYNYSANTGDKGLLSDSLEAINESNEILNQIQTALSEQFPAELEEMTAEYQAFKKLLNANINFVKDNGYADLRLVDDLSRNNSELSSKLEKFKDKIIQETGYKQNQSAQSARELAVTLSKMVATYTARSTSSVVQTMQGSDTEKPLDVIALEVDKQFSQLLENPSNSGETKRLLESAITKWQFIRSSFINYNEKNVNYVVNLYSKRIINGLVKVSESYTKS